MTFLQPLLLAALPLAGLPILIHLINQRRFQTIKWAAMMFLLAAQRMNRGYSKLRQILILLFRTVAIAGLIFAISRPLSSGWLGMASGGKADTTIILLDRSASMQQMGGGGAESKLKTGVRQLVQTLTLLGSNRWVLIDSVSNKPRELDKVDALLKLPDAEPTSSQADIAGMLESAREYIEANKTGRTEIWICSDLRENDWNAASGRWQRIRDSFSSLTQGVRFHLLAYPEIDEENVSVRITEVKRVAGEKPELLVSLKLTRDGAGTTPISVPVEFQIEEARSTIRVEMNAKEYILKDHRISLAPHQERGWGVVRIPLDHNPGDNTAFLAFDEAPVRQTLVVADDEQSGKLLQLAAAIAPDRNIKTAAELVSPDQVGTVAWERFGSVLWMAPLPEGNSANQLQNLLKRGGQVIFFPPKNPNSTAFAGVSWGTWNTAKPELVVTGSWRDDEDLLAKTLNKKSLPVGAITVRRYCGLKGEFTQLAAIGEPKANEAAVSEPKAPLLVRCTTDRGGVYFCTTTAAPSDSNLAVNGVVLYVLVQRMVAVGSEPLRKTRDLIAGDVPASDPATWQRLTGADEALPPEYSHHGGVYTTAEKTLVVNRPVEEDKPSVVEDAQLATLFTGLDFSRVDDAAGNIDSLVQEIWRMFMGTMMVAMVIEAALCLPRKNRGPVPGSALLPETPLKTEGAPA